MEDRPHRLNESPSQTAGPYVAIGLAPNAVGIGTFPTDLGRQLVDGQTRGERIAIEGRVLDGAGKPVDDCMVELWQADAAGLYLGPAEIRGAADPHFAGWGRCPATSETGLFRFETIKPGRVPFPGGRLQAPHVSLWIVARGINLGLNTRVYFADEAEANAGDPVLGAIEPRARAMTLIAARHADAGTGRAVHRIDIYLQGPNETVFFDI